MVARILLMVFFLFFLMPAQAALQAFVDRNPVAEGESLTLTVKSDENLSSDPDFSVLHQDFDVLGQSHGSNFQMINGSTSRSIQWQITLIPKHTGELVIPSIHAGGQATQAIVLNVSRGGTVSQQNGDLFLEVTGEPAMAYLQQQILYTVRLYSAANLGNQNTLSDPAFPGMDAVVKRLGDDRAFQTTRNGRSFDVIERRYAVYPQKSGKFESQPVQFDGDIIEGAQGGGMFGFFNQSHHKRIHSKSLSFTVLALPAGIGADKWLPASDLQMKEQWSADTMTAGEPVTRTVTIQAQGVMASQLPVIELSPVEGLKFYPDQAALKDNLEDNGINSVRTQKIAILPERAGHYTLPAIEVKWWNVQANRMETATLPARNLTVLPGKPVDTYQAPASAALVVPAKDLSVDWLSWFLGAGWLATIIFCWWRKPLVKTTTENIENASDRKLENKIRQSCLKNNAEETKSNLLAWAKLHWHAQSPNSLSALAALCSPELASAIHELEKALYGQQASWQGEALWQVFKLQPPAGHSMNDEKAESLAPLYLMK
jgi:hypothetical protein